MITKHMRLNTASDAHQWADSMLEGISSHDYDCVQAVDLLSRWLWANKPAIGCLYSEHLVDGMDQDKFWSIIAAAEVSK